MTTRFLRFASLRDAAQALSLSNGIEMMGATWPCKHSVRSTLAVMVVALFAWCSAARCDEVTELAEENPSDETVVVQPYALPFTMRAGELMLEGRIESVNLAGRQLTMSVVRTTRPDGSSDAPPSVTWRTIQFGTTSEMLGHEITPATEARPAQADNGTAQDEPAETAEENADAAVPPAPQPVIPTAVLWTAQDMWTQLIACRSVVVIGPEPGPGKVFSARGLVVGDLISSPYVPDETTFTDTTFYGGVKPWVAASGLRVGPRFGISSIGGKAARASGTSHHPLGLALDFMVDRNAAKGDSLAMYFLENAGLENVEYVIWKDTLVYPGRRVEWAKIPIDYSGDITRRHMDHVHVSYRAVPSQPMVAGELRAPAKLASRGGARRKTRRRR